MPPATPPPATPPTELPSSFTLDDVASLLGLALAAAAAYFILRWLLATQGMKLVARANPKLATLFEHEQVLPSLALFAPVLLIGLLRSFLVQRFGWAYDIISQIVTCYLIIVIALTTYRLLNALETYFINERDAKYTKAIRRIFYWLRIATIAISVVFALNAFTSIPVTTVLTWIGIIAAAGSIIFGDMLYNAVSRVILKERGLVSEGDWLEIPALQINGEVKLIGPQIVQIQNWDNTLATVTPRYLLTNTFRNWRHMYQVGTRRILRYIYIDVGSVRPLDDELHNSAAEFPDVAAFLAKRVEEFGSPQLALATLTNVALYRAYLMGYLGSHPKVAKNQIWRVSNEDAIGGGLPLLMLAYLTETHDIAYRMLDAEIYEHALAIAPLFGLSVYQSPSGDDLQALRNR